MRNDPRSRAVCGDGDADEGRIDGRAGIRAYRRGRITIRGMARLAARLDENAPGAFFVDDSCIDCDACRQIAPATFVRSRRLGQSIVVAQPEGRDHAKRALMAVIACPTASIGCTPKRALDEAIASFPERLEDDVYYCGWHAKESYGAASYLIVRSRGNVLVDSPRAAPPLHPRIEALGGVRTMVLSHRDDIADHAAFARHFGCERVMHAADAGALPVERRIAGVDPVVLDEELTIIPVPGHTRGSIALLYRDKFLFTGDHLWWDEDDERLDMGRDVCWYSWADQLRSLERLRDFRFEWILPGHGRRFCASSADAMRSALDEAIQRLKRRS
jgi:glyoxylase-like metal-dependent hydrolase (beta-lactamase superfamily II)/ferredoxin